MSLLARFGKDRSGNVMMLFGLALVPVLGLAGAALDYARASTARATLDAAVDSAALMVAKEAARLSDAELRRRAEALIRANIAGNADAAFGSFSVSVDRPGRRVSVSAQAAVQTSATRILGFETMPVSSVAQAGWGTNRIELAMVLDNTGSMATSGKMDELKKASLSLIDTMQRASTEAGQIRVSIVPFATQVRLANSHRDENWLRFNPSDSNPLLAIRRSDWQGCISDRDEPLDTADTAPTGAQTTLYPGARCESASLARILPLTDNWRNLKDRIGEMTPVGCTNITSGVVWGATTLGSGQPLTGAAAAGTPGLTKYMIVLTDGNNTMNRFITNRNCYDSNATRINPKTNSACDNAKAAGIRIYTIRVIEGDRSLLQGCASKADMYYEVRTASELGAVFEAIAREISAVRLTM